MKRSIIKFCYPIVYAGLLLLIPWAIYFTVLWLDMAVHFYGPSNWWIKTMSLVLLFLIPLIFWLVNKVLTKLENLTKPTVGDHYRQSALLYALICKIH